tara:strand:- start:1042 stop:1971 length:930 start_codon:yes stop_codon:yes gene_type:complete
MDKKNNKLIYKYKINKVKKLFYEDILLSKLENIINNPVNTIFHGNEGCGKTSICNILKKKYKDNIQLSNFNSKGYDYITSNINNFIKFKSDNKKIIILENIDNISIKAQHFISEFLNVNNIYYIITCKNLNNIIESIQSNCIIVHLQIDKNILFSKLLNICNKENIIYDIEAINYLIEIYNYDIRKIINIIDIINISFNELNINNINFLLNKIDNNKIKTIINYLSDSQLKLSLNIISELLNEGYSIEDIILTLISEIEISKISEHNKINIINILNTKYIMINEIKNSKLQLFACLAEICKFNKQNVQE